MHIEEATIRIYLCNAFIEMYCPCFVQYKLFCSF